MINKTKFTFFEINKILQYKVLVNKLVAFAGAGHKIAFIQQAVRGPVVLSHLIELL
jgi:hypothetical protein